MKKNMLGGKQKDNNGRNYGGQEYFTCSAKKKGEMESHDYFMCSAKKKDELFCVETDRTEASSNGYYMFM